MAAHVAGLAFSAILAFLAGFACRRGTICAVVAAREMVEHGRGSRLAAFLKGSIAAALITLPLAWLLPQTAKLAPSFEVTRWVLIGGAVFGLGALLNGGCAFGTLVHIAGGNTSYLTVVPGIVLGYVSAQMMPAALPVPAPPLLALAEPGRLALLAFAGLVALGLAVGLPALIARGVSLAGVKGWLGSHTWRPGEATVVMGLTAGILYATAGKWTYINLLADLAARPPRPAVTLGSIIACLALVIGAVTAAVLAGKFALRAPEAIQALRSFGGGMLFGLGASLVPGGNDTMVLHLLPALTLNGMLAYIAMVMTLVVVLSLLPRARAMPGKA